MFVLYKKQEISKIYRKCNVQRGTYVGEGVGAHTPAVTLFCLTGIVPYTCN